MKNCPLCGQPASIQLPDWSGGRFGVDCAHCGEFSTNQLVIDEMERLRAAGSPRIAELKYTIQSADHPWYLNWSPRLGMIVFEAGPAEKLTKRNKKAIRKALCRPNPCSADGGINLIYVGKDASEDS